MYSYFHLLFEDTFKNYFTCDVVFMRYHTVTY